MLTKIKSILLNTVQILRITFWFIVMIPIWIIGLIVIPIGIRDKIPLSSGLDNMAAVYPNYRMPKWAWPWNNRMDGIAGDRSWRSKHHPKDWWTPRSMYIWAASRNYCFNWRVVFGGLNGMIEEVTDHGPTYGRVDNYEQYQGAKHISCKVEGSWLRKHQYKACYMYPFKVKGKRMGLFIDIGPDITGSRGEGFLAYLTFSFRVNPFKGFEEVKGGI